MDIGNKIKQGVGKLSAAMQAFMAVRNGPDNLSRAMTWAGLALLLVGMVLRLGIFSLLGMALYAVSLWRMLSKDKTRRLAENRKYQSAVSGVRTKCKQAKVRFSNRKQYKYLRCPECHGLIRLPRGCGQVTVHCKPCDHHFKAKA